MREERGSVCGFSSGSQKNKINKKLVKVFSRVFIAWREDLKLRALTAAIKAPESQQSVRFMLSGGSHTSLACCEMK